MRCAEAVGLAAILALVAASGAAASPLLPVGPPSLLAPADVAGALAFRGAAGAGDLGPARGPWVEALEARLWGLPELPLQGLRAGLGVAIAGGVMAVGASWRQLGEDLVRHDVREAWVGWRRGVAVAVLAGSDRVSVDGVPADEIRTSALEFGPDLPLPGTGSLAVRLRTPLAGGPERRGRPLPVASVTLRTGALAAAAELLRRDGIGVAAAGEFALALTPSIALGGTWESAGGAMGPTLAVRLGFGLLRTMHQVHPVLGVTHRFTLCLGAVHAARR